MNDVSLVYCFFYLYSSAVSYGIQQIGLHIFMERNPYNNIFADLRDKFGVADSPRLAINLTVPLQYISAYSETCVQEGVFCCQ